jgi:hypothetical protein
MRRYDPEGFKFRDPGSRQIIRKPLTALGPHHEWNADGHDKTSKYGFPIWGLRDKWSGKWLGLWVMPNNRLADVIAWLYLSVLRELGGGCHLSTRIADRI